MAKNYVEGETHTGRAFIDFAYDFLAYSIPRFGYLWIDPPNHERLTKKVFKESFGDAAIIFRMRHQLEFDQRLAKFFSSGGDEMTEYLEQFCNRTFKGNVPLMEVVIYFAFLLDSCLHSYGFEMLEEVYSLADETYTVFYKYIDRFFTIVGGWHALYQVAEQYVKFIESSPEGLEVSKL